MRDDIAVACLRLWRGRWREVDIFEGWLEGEIYGTFGRENAELAGWMQLGLPRRNLAG